MYPVESGLYYLSSRYYNPAWGRFINADIFVSTGQGVLGSNMFAYCSNNPICFVDYQGTYVMGVLGLSTSGGFGIGGGVAVMTIWDGKGNMADIVTGYYGGGTPNIGGSLDLIIYSRSAEDIFQFVYGYTACAGGSAWVITGNYTMGMDLEGNYFDAATLSLGISAAPAEGHAGIGFAQIIDLIAYKGRRVPKEIPDGFFSDMDPRILERLPKKYQVGGRPFWRGSAGGACRAAYTK